MKKAIKDFQRCIECDIYFDQNNDVYWFVRKGQNPHDVIFLLSPNVKFFVSQKIQLGQQLADPFYGASSEDIVFSINKNKYATDGSRRVCLFDTVTIEFLDGDKETKTVTIVDNPNATYMDTHIVAGIKITDETPIGKALVRAKINEIVEIEQPTGTRCAVIKALKKRPEMELEDFKALFKE